MDRTGGSKTIPMQPHGEGNLPRGRTQFGSLPRGFQGDKFKTVEYLKNGIVTKVFTREGSPTRPAFRSASLPRGLGRGLVSGYLRDGAQSARDGSNSVRDGPESAQNELQTTRGRPPSARGRPQSARGRPQSARRSSTDGTLTTTITGKSQQGNGQSGKFLARQLLATQESLLMGQAKEEAVGRQGRSKSMDRGISAFVRSYSMRESSTSPKRSSAAEEPSNIADHTPITGRRALLRSQSNKEHLRTSEEWAQRRKQKQKAKLTISFIDKNANVLPKEVRIHLTKSNKGYSI